VTTQARDKSFDRIAASYDDVRPGYPDALYDRIIEFGSLAPTTRVLEVGSGTGKATLPLAERGFEMRCIEPGVHLAALARANLAHLPKVAFVTTTFEEWPLERASFGMAFCAQAFHWLDPARRLPRFAEALRDRGVLALFGNVPRLPPCQLRDDLDVCYETLAPSLSNRRGAETWYGGSESPIMPELRACHQFEDIQFTAFDWKIAMGGALYCQLLSTYSDHSTLPPSQLATLLTRIGDIVRAHGGTVELSYRTGVFLARRVSRQRA
jgi:SAM-dependent methyltransferase